MIEVEGLTKYYGNYHALKGVTFSVAKGEILGFLGPNGAGKTTTMRILTCFFPATGGKARVAGFDVFEEPLEVRKRIGYLPENVPLYKDITVEDYLEFAAGIKGVDRRDVKNAVTKVMDECVLTDVAYKFIGELSKGYRQRVGLAQALVNDPEVLILDEPTIGLDPRQIIDIRQLIKNLAGRRTVILGTHILPEVSMICQRVIIINEGKLIAVDTPDNLMRQLQSSAQIVLLVRGPQEEVAQKLGMVKGVKGVTKKASGGYNGDTYIVEAMKNVDIRKDLAMIIVNNHWDLLEMRPVSMSLEDIFIKLVTDEETAGH